VFEEDGNPCGENLILRSWLYCKDHKESGPKQAKKRKTKEHVRRYRAKNKAKYLRLNSDDQFRHRHGLTKPQVKPLLDHSETLQEEYPCKDDFHEGALRSVNDIMWCLLNPPDDIPNVAKTTRKWAGYLHIVFKAHQAVCPDRITDRLIVYTEELQRDSGTILSPGAFTAICAKAKEVLALWREKQEIPGFIYALFVTMELNRLKYFATHHRRFLDKAHRWLTATAGVCDQALNRCNGTHKQPVSFLAFYVPLLKGVLAFNGGEPEQAKNSLPSLHRLAKTIADDYGTTPGTEAIRFAYLTYLAQFSMRSNNIDGAYEYLTEAEQLCSTLQWPSIQSQLEIASVKAALGLMSDDENRYKDLHEYIVLFQHHPFLTHYNSLQELKKHYKKAVDASLFNGIPLYFDTMFRHLHPFLLSV
jgi:hypothetical protein